MLQEVLVQKKTIDEIMENSGHCLIQALGMKIHGKSTTTSCEAKHLYPFFKLSLIYRQTCLFHWAVWYWILASVMSLCDDSPIMDLFPRNGRSKQKLFEITLAQIKPHFAGLIAHNERKTDFQLSNENPFLCNAKKDNVYSSYLKKLLQLNHGVILECYSQIFFASCLPGTEVSMWQWGGCHWMWCQPGD